MEPVDLRQRDVGELLGLAFSICRERFADLAKAVAVVVIPASIFTALLMALVIPSDPSDLSIDRPSEVEFGASLETDENGQLTEVDGSELTLAFAGIVLGFGLAVMASQLSTAATFKLIAGEYAGERLAWNESVSYAFARFWPLVWLQLVYGLLLLIGFFLLVIPGIYLSVAWTVIVPVFLFEHARGWRALSRSRELISGRWWPTLGLLFVVSGATAIVSAVLTPLLTAVMPAGSDLARAASEGVAGGLVAVVTTPFAAAVITALYFDARVRKEDMGITELRHGLGAGESSEQW